MKVRRSIATLAVVAGGLVPLAHSASAGASIGDCSGVAVAGKHDLEVVLAAHAVYPGAMVRVRCGIVQDGGVVAYAEAAGPGAAVGATVVPIDLAPFTVCTDLVAVYSDGRVTTASSCP